MPNSIRIRKARQAARLRDREGLNGREVAYRMGISRSYAAALLTDPTGSLDRARKAGYGRPCANCGITTDGSNGRYKAPLYCAHCHPHVVQRKWTPERIVEAIREWARRRGYAPKANEWDLTIIDPDGYEFPSKNSVYDNDTGNLHPCFDEWGDAIEAAGFPRPSSSRNYNHDPWKVENMADVKLTRAYLVFRVSDDGDLELIGEVESHSTSKAIEQLIDNPGRYAATPRSSVTEYTVASRFVASPAQPYEVGASTA